MGNSASTQTNSDDVEQAFKQQTDKRKSGSLANVLSSITGWFSRTPECSSDVLQPLIPQSDEETSINSTNVLSSSTGWLSRGPESSRDKRQPFTQQSDDKTPVNSTNFFWSIMGWFSRTPESCRDEKQPFTQQSDEETPVNSRRQEDPTHNIDTQELIKRLNATEKEQAKNRMIIHGQEEMIEQLQFQIKALEQQFEEEKKEKQSLLTRLSQISSVQLTEGNPNIADLSDPNRPDKLAEQISELYDNQWTDSFQVLCESQGLEEENAINVLLTIILTVYKECRTHAENQNRQLMESMCLFTGVEVGGDRANESIIRESMHNLRSYRAKNFSAAMAHNKKKIEDSLQSMVGSDVCNDCQVYIAECIHICWLMCIKSPPMYISTQATEKFDHNLYTSYTKSGKYVSYVVWPTLFQYENGPIMKKGVAQGTN